MLRCSRSSAHPSHTPLAAQVMNGGNDRCLLWIMWLGRQHNQMCVQHPARLRTIG